MSRELRRFTSWLTGVTYRVLEDGQVECQLGARWNPRPEITERYGPDAATIIAFFERDGCFGKPRQIRGLTSHGY